MEQEEDEGFVPMPLPGTSRGLVQVVSDGVVEIQKYLARSPDAHEGEVARLARDVMMLMAVAGMRRSAGEEALVRRVHRAAFDKRMLYGLALSEVKVALAKLSLVSNEEGRSAIARDLLDYLRLWDPAFAALTLERTLAMMRDSSIGARGAGKHGPAYTAAALSLAANAFGLRVQTGETKGKALARIAKLFRASAGARADRKHNRQL